MTIIDPPNTKPPQKEWPLAAGWKAPPERPVTMENAIMFGFKIAVGMTLFFFPLWLLGVFVLWLATH